VTTRAIIVGVLLVGSTAGAQAPDVRAVLSRQALELALADVEQEVKGPQAVDSFGTEYDCPFTGDASAQVEQPSYTVELEDSTISPNDVSLVVHTRATVKGHGNLKADNLGCFFGDLDCKVAFTLDRIPVAVEVVPQLQQGRLRFTQTQVRIDLAKHRIDLDLSDCGTMGDIVSNVYDLFSSHFIPDLEQELTEIARKEIVASLEHFVNDIGEIGGDTGAYKLTPRVTGMPMDGTKLGLDLAVDLAATTQASCSITADSRQLPTTKTPPEFLLRRAHLGVAISRNVLQRMLREAWRAGLFCFRTDYDLGEVEIKTTAMPEVTLVPGGDARMHVLLPGVAFSLINDETTVSGRGDITVDWLLGLDFASAVLLSDPQVTVENVDITADNELLDYVELLKRVLPAVLQQQVGAHVLIPRVFHQSGDILGDYYLTLADTRTTADYIYLYGTLVQRPHNDTKPPETHLVQRPRQWGGAAVNLAADAQDDQTPHELLRYRWRVDGGPWTAPSLDARYTARLDSGSHTVEVAAVDLNDNIDPTPATITFSVDAQAPTLEVTLPPPRMVTVHGVAIGFKVTDNLTPVKEIKVHATIERDRTGEQPSSKVGTFTGISKLQLDVLRSGRYHVSLTAEDNAGNQSVPSSVDFQAVLPDDPLPDAPTETDPLTAASETASSGCSCNSTSRRPTWLALVALLLFALTRYQRRRATIVPQTTARNGLARSAHAVADAAPFDARGTTGAGSGHCEPRQPHQRILAASKGREHARENMARCRPTARLP